ncbi:TPA: hypothetical protein LUJ82_003787 [Acinetobacter baumannii]|uniref:hypothetical protein n=1 Tax=Acinetobacter calcoaceticus/baumannii complex TaxID=909768 RepID=UPI0002CF4A36|nr:MULTISPECIES: hypothetical protein [Acinetobacter calcoaceticus/baumannii complex]MDB0281370.1 hypothetical protein [Acinetobacter seifertii]ENV29468.1 hypothetical protein F961_01994 [Acinetobacter baumannii NIPH 60]MBD0530541.1 hypothetical protein [Acinetobacter baumannii]MCZ2937698.1 hypothetical protein [Acinetobacter baumannii]MCZ3068912.1 hypothetical protein [Acinetobacter baumannii]
MNQKTILGLAAILALTLISIAGFYFFSPKHTTEKTVQASTSEASSAQPLESASSEATSTEIAAAEVDGIDVKELTMGSKSLSDHEPELLSFEFDKNLKSVDTLLSMLPYDELPQFEQDNIDKYQGYVFAKAAKDTGKSVKDFSLQEHGALESEQAGNRYYVYKFDNGTDCEIHLVSIDLNTGNYGVSYNYC